MNCSEQACSEMGNYSICAYRVPATQYRRTNDIHVWCCPGGKEKIWHFPPEPITFPFQIAFIGLFTLMVVLLDGFFFFFLVPNWWIFEKFEKICLLKSQVISTHYFSWCQKVSNYRHLKCENFAYERPNCKEGNSFFYHALI